MRYVPCGLLSLFSFRISYQMCFDVSDSNAMICHLSAQSFDMTGTGHERRCLNHVVSFTVSVRDARDSGA